MELDLKRKRTKSQEENYDCLIELPEHLLHHILSFLTMKDVIRTCILSTKWKDVWLFVPCLSFPMTQKLIKKEMNFITQCLLHHKGLTIQKLNFSLKNITYAKTYQIDWWIHFALTRNVKEFHLDYHNYNLHQDIFGCTFLTTLELIDCRLNVPKKSWLRSLKDLLFERVIISGESFSHLISFSPCLERVSLIDCSIKEGHRLSIANVSLKTLKIYPIIYPSLVLEFAPYVVSFEVGLMIVGIENKFVFKRMQSLENASFVCRTCQRDKIKSIVCRGSHRPCKYLNDKNSPAIIEMLDNVSHVKTLRLDSCYIEVLSIKENKSDLSSFDVKYLEIETGLTRLEIPGLAHILKYSPNVETVIINVEKISKRKFICNSYDTHYVEEGGYWKDLEPVVFGMLKKLKIVRVNNFMKNFNAVKVKGKKIRTGDYIKKLKSDMEFLKFLLRNCEGLENLIITCIDIIPEKINSKLMLILKQDLLALATAFRDVKISIK